MNDIDFFVHGTPVPQGSMKGYVVNGRARVTSDNSKLKPWRESVKTVAIEQGITRLDEPLHVILHFFMPRPKSYAKRIVFPWRKPDLDKLVRGVFDALTEASVWTDDALVVSVFASKRFADEEQPMGVRICIGEPA